MAINWQAEAAKYEKDLLADLTTLLRIKSERDIEHKTDDAPLGPGPAKALQAMLALAERDGFKTLNVDNVAGRIEMGDGDEIFGLFGHMDVVPAGPGWNTDPYEPVIKDGKIYARGSSDDKGPSIAAYYALKMIKDLGLPVNKKIHLLSGPMKNPNGSASTATWKLNQHPTLVSHLMLNFLLSMVKKGLPLLPLT